MKFNNILLSEQKKEIAYANLLLKKSQDIMREESNFSKAIDHLNNSLFIYKKHRIYDKVKESYNNLNQYLNQYSQIDEAKERSIEALSYFETEIKNYESEEEEYPKLKTGIANSYANHGIALTREEDFERARYYFSLSSSVYEYYGNWDQRTQLYINLAGVNKVVGNFNQAIHYLNKSLTHASQTTNAKNIYHTIVLQLANLYMQQENFKKSIDFFIKSFQYADAKESLLKFSINVYYCIAHCNLELFEERKCIENLNKAIALEEQTDANLYDAHIALLKGRLLVKQGNFNEAIPYFAECLKKDSGIGAQTRRLSCINAIICFKINASKKQSDLLEQVFNKNYLPSIEELIEEINNANFKVYDIFDFKKVFETLGTYYEKENNYKEAYSYNKKVNLLYGRLTKINLDDQVDEIHHNFDIHLLEKQIETEVKSKNTLLQKNVELETNANQQTQRLLKENEELKEFTNILAHDLKEPARKINNYVDFFLKQTKEKLSEEEILLMSNVLVKSENLILMMDDLIVYSFLGDKYEPGKQTNLQHLLNALLKTYNIPQDISEVHLSLEELPLVNMSPNHITQIFRRLIDNVIKFKSEKRELKLKISTFIKNEKQYIKVQDNGMGFNPELVDKAFKIFKKINGDKYRGNGVGLAVCKKIIDLYNQTIYIDTKIGKGTAVNFSVPV